MKKITAKIDLSIILDDKNNLIGYEMSLPYDSVKNLTENDNQVIEMIRDVYFWESGVEYNGRESFKDHLGGDTRVLKFKVKKS